MKQEKSEPRTTTLSTTGSDIFPSISLPGEKWANAKGFSSNYYVSNMGRLLTTAHHGGYRTAIMKPGTDPSGHLRTVMNGRTIKVHRVVAQTWIENPENLPVVNHLDCDPSNNRVENLEWTTWAGNSQHAFKMGRLQDSLAAARAKIAADRRFSDEQLRYIWDAVADQTTTERIKTYTALEEVFPFATRRQITSVWSSRHGYTAYKSWKANHITQSESEGTPKPIL